MKVLVGVDNTQESHLALAYACHLLEHFDAEVHALYVQPDGIAVAPEIFYAPFVGQDGLDKWINAQTLQIRKDALQECSCCLAGKVPCEPHVSLGDPAEGILDAALDGSYDLIVLGSHGYSALKGFLLGAVHAKILHHATQPVLIVRDFREIHRVLVVYRGSTCDQKALEFIAPLLARKKPEITILHVEESGRSDAEAFGKTCLLEGNETLKQLGHDPVTVTRKGNFVDEVAKEVIGSRCDLIVLGAYGHQRSKIRQLISDEALNLVRSTTRPVLVFRDKSQD
jgi:nucleotide-binding universal stress UspA family protein